MAGFIERWKPKSISDGCMELVFWFTVFPIAAGFVAKSKGRNVFLWGGLGLLLGPFAILIVALLKTTERGDQSYQ